MRTKHQPVHETGLVMLLHCRKCTWLNWFAGIPLLLILSAAEGGSRVSRRGLFLRRFLGEELDRPDEQHEPDRRNYERFHESPWVEAWLARKKGGQDTALAAFYVYQPPVI